MSLFKGQELPFSRLTPIVQSATVVVLFRFKDAAGNAKEVTYTTGATVLAVAADTTLATQ